MATRNFHWSSVFDCVMHETDGAGVTTVEYTHEPGAFGPLVSETRSGTESYHHYDALGSTTFLSDTSGNLTDTFQYDAWGNEVIRTGTTPTPYKWVGRWGYQQDASTGGYCIRARNYLPTVARWMSVDPVRFFVVVNCYSYVMQRPQLSVDPSGLIVQIIQRNGWSLALSEINMLEDNLVSFDVQWVVARLQNTLPAPVVHQQQGWMLIRRLGYVTYYNKQTKSCQTERLKKPRHIVDVVGLFGFDDPRLAGWVDNQAVGPIGAPDITCQWIEFRSILGGINGDDYESRLPPISNWHDPPHQVIEMIKREARARFQIYMTYHFTNPDVCKKCDTECFVEEGRIDECVRTPWGIRCNKDWPDR